MQKTTSEMGFSENFTSIHVFSTFFFKYLLVSFLMQDGCPIYVTRIKDLVWSLGERTFKNVETFDINLPFFVRFWQQFNMCPKHNKTTHQGTLRPSFSWKTRFWTLFRRARRVKCSKLVDTADDTPKTAKLFGFGNQAILPQLEDEMHFLRARNTW